MKCLQDIYEAIATDGFRESALQIIDEFVNDIENGSTDLPRFNQREHSGICKAGSALIGASIVASYATRSLTAGSNAGSGQECPRYLAELKRVGVICYKGSRKSGGLYLETKE